MDEATYADRIYKAARMCRGELKKADVGNHVVYGLKPSVLETITHKCPQMSEADNGCIDVVLELELSIGNAHRYLIRFPKVGSRTAI